jgi:hypothetical protein
MYGFRDWFLLALIAGGAVLLALAGRLRVIEDVLGLFTGRRASSGLRARPGVSVSVARQGAADP